MDPCAGAQDVMRCDLCKTAVVQMHCDTCLVNLCKACVGEHISTGEPKDHKVVKFQDRKSTLLYPGCSSHKIQQCTMYCKHCDIPVCPTCIASDQHQGHKVSEISQVVDEKKGKFIKEHIELKEIIFPTFQDIASDVQNKISQLDKKYGDLSKAIKKHEEAWHREIDELVKKLKGELDEMKNSQIQTLQKLLDEINKKISDIKDEINSFKNAIHNNDMSKLLINKSNVQMYRTLPEKFVASFPKFIPAKIQGELLDKLFGALSPGSLTLDKQGYSMKTTQKSPEAGSSPPVKQLLDEPETVTTIDTGYGNLYKVACRNEEEIWTRGNGIFMKLFSVSQGSLLKSITSKSRAEPCDIAVMKNGDLVYTDHHDRTINTFKNETIEELIRFQKWIPRNFCRTNSDELLVMMYENEKKQTKVVLYSGSTEKKTIQFDDKGEALYSSSTAYKRYITENRNLDICVADHIAGAVVVVNQAGKLRFRYTGHTPAPKNKPFGPRGITTDSQSHILTADDNNDCVHITDQDGQFLRYIECGLSDPKGLSMDTNDNLFVAEYGNKVKKIKYLE